MTWTAVFIIAAGVIGAVLTGLVLGLLVGEAILAYIRWRTEQ